MGTSNQGLVAMPRLSPKSMAPAEKPNPSLMPIGLGYAALYYVLFRFVIRKWNLKTPGREDEGEESGVLDSDARR